MLERQTAVQHLREVAENDLLGEPQDPTRRSPMTQQHHLNHATWECNMSDQALRDAIKRYNAEGLDGLRYKFINSLMLLS
jgi:hypothetical protein